MNLPLFIASRLFREQRGTRRSSSPAIRIAILGIAIGLAVMIVSVSVVLGFKHTIRDKVVGFGSHITVADFSTLHTSTQYPVVMNDSMIGVIKSIPGVRHVERYAVKQGILKTDDDFLGIMLKGVGPEYDPTFFRKNIVKGEFPKFSDKISGGKIVISQSMASKLRLNVGDRVFAYFMDGNNVRTRRFTVSGIYQTNLSHFDESVAFTDLYTTVRLNGWEDDQVSGAEVLVKDFSKVNEVENEFVRRINRTVDHYGETYSSETIYELYPQIFSWLGLMDLNVWVILGLMVAVAGFTMISGLMIIILERVKMIGILKALGSTNRQVRHTFMWFAAMIIGVGMSFGDILGLGLVYFQDATGLVKLDPAAYYVSTVPVEVNWLYIILINLATLLITMLVLVLPSHIISGVHPAQSMRYE